MKPKNDSKSEDYKSALVTVIVPCFNCSATLSRAIYSIISQSHRPIEVVLVNGHDNNEKTILAMKSAENKLISNGIEVVLAYSEKNLGPGYDRNLGLSLSRGSFVAFLDSDDYWDPTKIEKDISFLVDSNADLVCSSFCGQKKIKNKNAYQVALKKNIFTNRVNTSTVLSKNEKWLHFDDRVLFFAEDFFLWNSLLSQQKKIWFRPDEMTHYSSEKIGLRFLHLKQTHESVKFCLKTLYDESSITFIDYLSSSLFELFKYLRRKVRNHN